MKFVLLLVSALFLSPGFGALARASDDPAYQKNCVVLGMRDDHPHDIGILCIDPLLNAIALYEFDSITGPHLQEDLSIQVTGVDSTELLGKWVVAEGKNQRYRVWLKFGPGNPPIVQGALTYLGDGYQSQILRYVWEESPSSPTPCSAGRMCH